jgi:hypothetical protein
MKKITDLMMKLNEIDFKSQDAFKKYKAKHKMRDTTKVNVAGKDTTAGEADKDSGSSEPQSSGNKLSSFIEKNREAAVSHIEELLDDMGTSEVAMEYLGWSEEEAEDADHTVREDAANAIADDPELAEEFIDEDDIKKISGSNKQAPVKIYPSMEDAEAIMDEFQEGGLEKGVDYEETTAYGDDIPNEIIALSDKAKSIVDIYDDEDEDEDYDDTDPANNQEIWRPKSNEKSQYGAKQKGIGAGEKNLKGPTSDANSVSGDAKAEKKVLEKLRSITKDNDVDLCSISVPGTNLFCAGNKQIPRDEMPQLKSTVVAGGKADELVKAGKLDIDAKTGEVNTEDLFKSMLEKEGITMKDPEPRQVTSLKATQNQLVGSKVNMFAKVLAGEQPIEGKYTGEKALKKWQDALREPIIVSKDGYILDGHHRWAALVQHDIANGGSGDVEMDVKEVDMGATDLVDKTNKFTNDMGLATKSGGKDQANKSDDNKSQSSDEEAEIDDDMWKRWEREEEERKKREKGLLDKEKKTEGTMKLAQIIEEELIEELKLRENTTASKLNEKLARGLKPLLQVGSTITKNAGENALMKLSDKFDRIDDEYAGDIASHLDMAIELMQDGYPGDATKMLKQFNKKCKDVLKGKTIASVFEGKLTESKSLKQYSDDQLVRLYKQMEDERVSGSAAALFRAIAKELKNRKVKVEGKLTEGRPMPMDTPNEFAYTDFKKWAYQNRTAVKNILLKALKDNRDDGTYLFLALTQVWLAWARKKAKDWTGIPVTPVGKKNFGRALAVMMKKDNLVIKRAGNKLTTVESKVNESSSIWKALDAKWKLYDESMDIENDLRNITATIKQLHKNMEQEAEPEGGKVADRYGREIEKYEKMYKKRKAEFKKVNAKIDKLEQY